MVAILSLVTLQEGEAWRVADRDRIFWFSGASRTIKEFYYCQAKLKCGILLLQII